MARRKKKKLTIRSEETTTLFGVLSFFAAVVLAASIFVQNTYLTKIHAVLGIGVILGSLILLIFALRMFGNKFTFNKWKVLICLTIFLLSFISLIHLLEYNHMSDQQSLINGGGSVGYTIANVTESIFGYALGAVILFFVALISIVVGLSIPITKISNAIKAIINGITNLIAERIYPFFANIAEKLHTAYMQRQETQKQKAIEKAKQAPKQMPEAVPSTAPMMVGDLSGRNVLPSSESANINMPNVQEVAVPHTTVVSDNKFSTWEYPPIELLNKPKPYVVQDENVKKNSDIIEKTLESFGILAKVADVKIGPVVTQYALQITMGTKVAKINNLNKDLALALAAPSGMVRVEAPIPGTSLVGIEMPNAHPRMIAMRELMESSDWINQRMNLPLAVGRDVAGTIFVKDLQKMPHLLIAGSTGSGKSVTVNSFIISLLFKHSPNELKFIMVDPKQVEMSGYNGIPHLLVPVITDMEKVVNALKWALVEMENRYKMFKQAQVRNLEAYNARQDVTPLPFIVIIIDEMADLMMLQGVEVESCIVRLAQMARAVGIHLVLATQRPSVNVITGLIKANVPARIGMSVTSVVDSRVVLDTGGAETLLGKGDMLFKLPDSIRPIRVQGVMVSDEEIERVLLFIKNQSPAVEYSEEITQFQGGEKQKVGSGWEDSMFPDAVRVVVNAGRGSASILQSKLRIGYARAARLIEELEERGVVGPQDGSKPRDVLITDAEIFLGQSSGGSANEDSR